METRTALQAFHIAALVGTVVGFILDVLFKHQLNIVSLMAIAISGYAMFKYNELFWEVVEKYKRR